MSRSDTAVTADSTQSSGGDTLCAFAMIDTNANEEAPHFTNCRRDIFWSVANGLPQLGDPSSISRLSLPEVLESARIHLRYQALANDTEYMAQARTLAARQKITEARSGPGVQRRKGIRHLT